jgi:hypothetical protein
MMVIACACVVLIASGLVHGLWTDRWSDDAALQEAAGKLDQLPMTLGAWHGTTLDMEHDPNSGLAGMIARRYVHASDGKVVTLLLACGHAGPVCTHTPDVCYRANGYDVETPKRFQLTSKTAQAPPEFWTARFLKERAGGKTHLRVFWSWHGAETWRVADNPRLSFAGEKVLYKIYLIHDMVQPDEPLESDACVEFMHELLPILRDAVLETPANRSAPGGA